ncbi:hypothetical protein [Streptomyces zaomyceticus]|uniref:hypothetical protein n=1 Tax=Streptomyces zaomyceticus TaxID=68286 RepID=UPI00341D59F5
MAGEIEDAIERADREHFTQDPPKTLKGQIGYLLRQMGSARAVAREIGVTPDSVNRYRRGARKQAAATGIKGETRARFGYTAPVGSTDENRLRRLTVKRRVLTAAPGIRAEPALAGQPPSREPTARRWR